MKQKLILLLILCFFIGFAYEYLILSKNELNTYMYNLNNDYFIIQEKPIKLINKDNFVFDSYFKIYSFCKINYLLNVDDKIQITINNKKYDYTYSLEEPERIEVVKEIYIKEEPKINVYPKNDYTENTSEEKISIPSSLEYPVNTDIGTIIADISSKTQSNIQLTIDYSSVNPNVIGQYNVNFYSDNKTYSCLIKIM